MRATSLLRSIHPVTQGPALTYALGLSYAAKQSPPFVPSSYQPGSAGFAGQKTPLGRWVDLMKSLPAGRGELRKTNVEEGQEDLSDGGWGIDTAWQVRKWGAGEDFFAVVDGGNFVSHPEYCERTPEVVGSREPPRLMGRPRVVSNGPRSASYRPLLVVAGGLLAGGLVFHHSSLIPRLELTSRRTSRSPTA